MGVKTLERSVYKMKYQAFWNPWVYQGHRIPPFCTRYSVSRSTTGECIDRKVFLCILKAKFPLHLRQVKVRTSHFIGWGRTICGDYIRTSHVIGQRKILVTKSIPTSNLTGQGRTICEKHVRKKLYVPYCSRNKYIRSSHAPHWSRKKQLWKVHLTKSSHWSRKNQLLHVHLIKPPHRWSEKELYPIGTGRIYCDK